ncbi:MAG: glutaredoxin [Negativicutes bacterium]|nr:glutaredoxin [Negativicutes bacterium]
MTMKKITMFVLAKCPHCARAFQLIDEVKSERPELAEIEIEVIDEQVETELAARYDYHYVPAFFSGDRKLHEGKVEREDIGRVLAAAGEHPVEPSR